jgi:hypothetical protein
VTNIVNIQGTEAGSVTEGLPAMDLQSITDHMRAVRRRVGYNTELGRRCSNIIEIIEGLPRHPSEWIDWLMPDDVPLRWQAAAPMLDRQMADYQRLVAA